MNCFDCKQDKKLTHAVYLLSNNLLLKVCKGCFKRSYKPWTVTAG